MSMYKVQRWAKGFVNNEDQGFEGWARVKYETAENNIVLHW